VDYDWSRLTEGGQEVAHGWLKDKYGLSWQVVHTVLLEMISDPDPEKARRTTEAMLAMTKFDIAALQRHMRASKGLLRRPPLCPHRRARCADPRRFS
jgi:hypothetical protein